MSFPQDSGYGKIGTLSSNTTMQQADDGHHLELL
jgi:hypothetical protein